MEKIVAFVKDKSNPIKGFEGTREKVKKENKKLKTARFYLNDNSNSKSNARQVQLCYKLSS
jgi:Holliday junction resolvase-like predicted endonuclease